MSARVLITGGAGFIGSHLVDRLLDAGRDVRVLDSLEPQVHGDGAGNRREGVEYLEGSVLDEAAVDRALEGVDSVVHLAAQVGVGQSMYELARYVSENCLGTARLLERIHEAGSVETLLVASSMSIYGEGQYGCAACVSDDVQVERLQGDLEAGRWEPRCVGCGGKALPAPTSERKRLEPDSVYATTKRDQEELVLVFGRNYGIRAVALRVFNVYGPRQSLSNPYAGVPPIFASRLVSGRRPIVYEDGRQSRDFVHVRDVARAFELALDSERAAGVALNVGTGRPTTLLELANALAAELGDELEPEIAKRFRHGDVRHCWADVSAAREALSYEPRISLRDGVRELVGWSKVTSSETNDRTDLASEELERHGLLSR